MPNHEINKDLIDFIRLNQGIVKWTLSQEEKVEIIPASQSHEYVLKHFEVDDSIETYYYLSTANLISDREFQKMHENGYVGEKATSLLPFSNIIYSAYHRRSDLVFKLSQLLHSKKPYTLGGNPVKHLTDLSPYFTDYASGFKKGFDEFESKHINAYLTPYASQIDYSEKVFEYATKYILFVHSWAHSTRGFTTNLRNEIQSGFSHGKSQGYFYRAWSIILANSNLFGPFFRKNLGEKNMVPSNIDSINGGSAEIIKKCFGFLSGTCPRKHKTILKEADFKKLITWTISYYEDDCIVPDIQQPIESINTNKTYVQLAFRYLYKKLHPNRTYPSSLFEFYRRAFKPYSDDKEKNFNSVRNNDEVKKLMKLDY